MKIGSEYSGLFANFDGENTYQTPITDLSCGCSIYGSKILSCDVETRNCHCQSGFSGSKCDQECQFGADCDDYGPRTSLLRGGIFAKRQIILIWKVELYLGLKKKFDTFCFQGNSQQYSKVAVFGGQGGYGDKTEVIGKKHAFKKYVQFILNIRVKKTGSNNAPIKYFAISL